ncbi:hypothetical protein DYZ52_00897 [Listeria monocytogenes]|nr:recombinase family protein [Listeria monocytogenes]KHK12738.1 putative transposon DNA-invertase [Listeria monocytogenes SHL001]QWF96441.1 hypothetical protein KJV86_02042 [Listeria monocytogenes]RJY62573.1 hypothetical protein DYZ28_01025 [Listeria monocytogenes]RJY68390.1 hypothetical protein DYZ31_01024 [Listeria monocytogenes]
MIVAYARVSSTDQNLDRQIEAFINYRAETKAVAAFVFFISLIEAFFLRLLRQIWLFVRQL